MKKISIIVPCYNEELTIPFFYEAITRVSSEIPDVDFEYIFINDGSKDKTLEIIKNYSKRDKRVEYISFSRNFGKEAAVFAGFEKCSGDYISVIDADLQDPPELLKEMYRIIKDDGYDVVGTRRVSRKGEPLIRSLFSKMFYKIINKLSKLDMVSGERDYRLMTRKVVDSIISMKEYNRYSKGLFSFAGFSIKRIEYKNVKRVAGKSKWSFWKLFKYAIEAIVAFSTVPLSIASLFGVLFCLISFFAILFIFIKTLIYGDPVAGWPSLVCIILFTSGIQLLCLGIIGQYLSKIYLETKKRPIYIISETNMKEEE